MTSYGIIGERKGENLYIGLEIADNKSDAMAQFVEGKTEEEIKKYHRYFVFDFDATAEFMDEEAVDLEKME